MQTFIFIVGSFVSFLVIYGIFSQVPAEIRKSEQAYYNAPTDKTENT